MTKEKNNKTTETEDLYCSFCGKSKNEVVKLIAGPSVYICNECINLCNDIMRDECESNNNPEELRGEYIYELLEKHFEPMKLNSMVSFSCLFPITVHSKLETTIHHVLKINKAKFKFVGIGRRYYNTIVELNFSELWERKQHPFFVGPTQFEITGFNKSFKDKCLKNGLWLCFSENISYAMYLDHRIERGSESESIYLEIAASEDEGLNYIENIFNSIQSETKE
jgi:hypothetical protein